MYITEMFSFNSSKKNLRQVLQVHLLLRVKQVSKVTKPRRASLSVLRNYFIRFPRHLFTIELQGIVKAYTPTQLMYQRHVQCGLIHDSLYALQGSGMLRQNFVKNPRSYHTSVSPTLSYALFTKKLDPLTRSIFSNTSTYKCSKHMATSFQVIVLIQPIELLLSKT